ncbi:MAG TPA: hypothetical protein VMG36_04495 [Thermoplasmata archaeon]|nr:hypothetical protein [Thermoplasmata archaeon]
MSDVHDPAPSDPPTPAERAALGVSLVLNAPVLAGAAFLWLFLVLRPADLAGLAVALGFATALPLVLVVVLAVSQVLPDVFASTLGSRRWAFVGAAVAYVAGWGVLELLRTPGSIAYLMLAYGVNTLAFLVLSVRWKPSVHASGVTGPATWLALVFGPGALVFFALLVPVAWARLKLRAHTPTELVAGAGLAVGLTALQYALFVRGLVAV